MTAVVTLLSPLSNPQSWDVIQVGQQTSPGLCTLSGFKRANEWDVKKGKGTIGGTVTYVARPPAKGTITFQLWTEQHFTQWLAFLPLLKYDPTKKAVQAIDLYHPTLTMIDMTSFVTENVGAIEHAGNGLYTVVVDFLEYAPPPKASAVSTPSGSLATQHPGGTDAPSGAPADAVGDAQQKEIAALLNRAGQP